MRPIILVFQIFIAIGLFTACTKQGRAYNQNPICRQSEQKCNLYYDTMERTKTDRGAAIDLLREDCEDSQRACAEGVSRRLETSFPKELGTGNQRRY
jgi:hypothetical protein